MSPAARARWALGCVARQLPATPWVPTCRSRGRALLASGARWLPSSRGCRRRAVPGPVPPCVFRAGRAGPPGPLGFALRASLPRHQRTAGCAPLLPRCLGVGVASRRVGASGTQTCSRAPRGSPSAPPTQLLLLWIRTLDTADGRVTGAPRVPRQPPVPGGRDAGQGARPGALRACGRAPPPEPPPLEAGVVPHTSATAAFLRSEREAPSGCCEAGVGSSGQGRGGTARHSARAQTPRRPSPQPCPAAGAPAPPCRRCACLLTVGPFSPRPGGRRVHEGPAD